jgi:hypothetical protein
MSFLGDVQAALVVFTIGTGALACVTARLYNGQFKARKVAVGLSGAVFLFLISLIVLILRLAGRHTEVGFLWYALGLVLAGSGYVATAAVASLGNRFLGRRS